jgi:hypothetical protein
MALNRTSCYHDSARPSHIESVSRRNRNLETFVDADCFGVFEKCEIVVLESGVVETSGCSPRARRGELGADPALINKKYGFTKIASRKCGRESGYASADHEKIRVDMNDVAIRCPKFHLDVAQPRHRAKEWFDSRPKPRRTLKPSVVKADRR